MRLKNKIALITGAAKGQGKAAAKLFAREGAVVVVNDIAERDLGEAVVEEIKREGGRALYIQADVADSSEIKKMMEVVENTHNRLDILYNNAGVLLENDASVVDLEEEVWNKTIDINLKGIYLCCKWGIPLILKSGGGSIINTSSVAGYGGDEEMHAYPASKGGIIALSKSMALKYGPDNIRVNVICPGFVRTSMNEKYLDEPSFREKWLSATMLKRFGKPEEIAYAALFLASDEASFVTGSVYTAHGGLIK